MLAAGERILELLEIGRQSLGIEPQVITGGNDDVSAHRLVDSIDGVGEIVPSGLRARRRPQDGDELVPARPTVPRDREQDEQRETSALDGATAERPVLGRDREPAEDDETLHRPGIWCGETG